MSTKSVRAHKGQMRANCKGETRRQNWHLSFKRQNSGSKDQLTLNPLKNIMNSARRDNQTIFVVRWKMPMRSMGCKSNEKPKQDKDDTRGNANKH